MFSRIKTIRKALKLNQSVFGERLGVSDSTVGGWERGDDPLPPGRAVQICKEFHVRREWLERGEGEIFEPEESGSGSPSFVDSMLAMYDALPPKYQEIWDALAKELLKAKGDPQQGARNVAQYISGIQRAQNITFNGDILNGGGETRQEKK